MSDPPRRHRPLYRVYHLSPTGGIVRADILEAADDEDAIRLVLTLAVDHACELWDRARFVAKAEPPANALSREPVLTRHAAALDPTAAEIAEDGKPLER